MPPCALPAPAARCSHEQGGMQPLAGCTASPEHHGEGLCCPGAAPPGLLALGSIFKVPVYVLDPGFD